MRNEDTESATRCVCRKALKGLPSPVDDCRLPPPDVMGYLADRNIRREDFRRITEHVAHHWPNVVAVRCGVSAKRPYFSIHVSPFSRAAQCAHWPLGDWIEETFQTSDCDFIFLPPMDEYTYSPRISIYERSAEDEARYMREAA